MDRLLLDSDSSRDFERADKSMILVFEVIITAVVTTGMPHVARDKPVPTLRVGPERLLGSSHVLLLKQPNAPAAEPPL